MPGIVLKPSRVFRVIGRRNAPVVGSERAGVFGKYSLIFKILSRQLMVIRIGADVVSYVSTAFFNDFLVSRPPEGKRSPSALLRRFVGQGHRIDVHHADSETED